jgi:hypothetical protein
MMVANAALSALVQVRAVVSFTCDGDLLLLLLLLLHCCSCTSVASVRPPIACV